MDKEPLPPVTSSDSAPESTPNPRPTDSEPSLASIPDSPARVSDPFRSAPAEEKKFPVKPIVICIVIALLLGLGGLAIFKYRDSLSSLVSGSDSSGNEPKSGSTYITPSDSTDPVGDYIAYLEKRISTAETDIDKLSATLDLAEYLMSRAENSRALALMESISPDSFTTDIEYYAYYSSYARLYSASNLNDPALASEYSALAAEHDPTRISNLNQE